jgi:hypothetical protein
MESHEVPIYMPYCVIHDKVYEFVSSSALPSAIVPIYHGRRAKESKVTLRVLQANLENRCPRVVQISLLF